MSDEPEDFADAWYEEKSAIMQQVLGPEHNMVMHSVIPYAVGGGLDLFYYPNGMIPGTAIATKELSELPGEGSKNSVFSCYELVMFTRQELSLDNVGNKETPFGKVHSSINGILNVIAPYSVEATLNPGETCEFPADMEKLGGKCLIFDAYGKAQKVENACGMGPAKVPFGLLAVIEIFPEEMEYAREAGGGHLLEKLKAAGHYPYSDLDREAVV
ncbi:suppressor of fused domain protein [Blastopirellula marina]|uniref:Suppressor of fused-like domain-containing protein n=1 Tax=Blastopirellula marina TaxID=124 RepID=A0A2S8GRS8_9BACT|nr:suppressor of fused domain protein [Blastopirellula marina]PQO47112.1 hypothetical protein C5Y93_06375 [Blastopirellula marina]